MRSGPGRLALSRAAPPHSPSRHVHDTLAPVPAGPRMLFPEWQSPGRRLHARADAEACPSFSGQSFAIGLLLGLVIATVAFTSGWWYRRASRNRKKLRIDPYAANLNASRYSQAQTTTHHIITEGIVGSPPPPTGGGNQMSSIYHGSTTGLVSAASTPGFAAHSMSAQHGRSTSIRSTATTATHATHATARGAHPMPLSRSDVSLPLPLAQRDARGKFSTLEDPPLPPPPEPEESPVLPILRDKYHSMAPTRTSVWSTGGVTTDGWRPDREAHMSAAYTAAPSTATGEWFPRSPEAADFPFKMPRATQSLESLARTAVHRESVSSMLSSRSSRTRVAPPLPPPTSPLPTPPPPLPTRTLSSYSAVDEKRLLALQNALTASLPPSPSTPATGISPSSPLLSSHRRSASGRPLPDAPSAPNSAAPMSARDEKSWLSQPWEGYPPMPPRPDSPSGQSVAESSAHGLRRDTAPPAYSRPPSRFE